MFDVVFICHASPNNEVHVHVSAWVEKNMKVW